MDTVKLCHNICKHLCGNLYYSVVVVFLTMIFDSTIKDSSLNYWLHAKWDRSSVVKMVTSFVKMMIASSLLSLKTNRNGVARQE